MYGTRRRISDAHKRDKGCAIPGEIWRCAVGYGDREVPGSIARSQPRSAQAFIGDGKRWVVDLDLEKFFDRVNHDELMSRVARRVPDVRVLTSIRRLLEAGMMQDGLVTAQSRPRLRIAAASAQRLRQRIRELMRRGSGRSLGHTIAELNPLLQGWMGYFQHTQSLRRVEAVDEWLRRRLRCLLWRQWKRAVHRAAEAAPAWARRRSRLAQCGQWARTLVECRRTSPDRCTADRVLYTHGVGLAGGHPPAMLFVLHCGNRAVN